MIYVMSDIHGDFQSFYKMLVKINFSSYDELFILGDIVDKGKENLCLLDFIWKSENIHLLKGNHEYLFEIFKEIQSIKQEVKLLIVGSGELEKHLRKIAVEQGIDNNIIFLGRRDDVPRILSAMDIFVFPSRYEGLGNVLIEAQINGLYCYVSSEAVTKEVKITENIEFLSIKKPASFWANRIVNNYDDSRNRKVNLQEMENSGYSIDEIVKRLEKIYLRGEENEKSISYNGGL